MKDADTSVEALLDRLADKVAAVMALHNADHQGRVLEALQACQTGIIRLLQRDGDSADWWKNPKEENE